MFEGNKKLDVKPTKFSWTSCFDSRECPLLFYFGHENTYATVRRKLILFWWFLPICAYMCFDWCVFSLSKNEMSIVVVKCVELKLYRFCVWFSKSTKNAKYSNNERKHRDQTKGKWKRLIWNYGKIHPKHWLSVFGW